MDERFRGKGLWFGLGAVALIFLCLLLIAGAFIAVLAPARMAPVYVQPPAAGEGALQPSAAYYGPGPLGGLFFGVKMLFGLAFLGVLLLVFLGVVRRLFWGHYHWGPHYCAPVPPGQGWEGPPGAGSQPQADWRRHWHHRWGPPPWWGPAPERAAGEGEAPGAPESGEGAPGYRGPQE
jgi:hypothetical protein